jgi:hypothetical protein
VTGSDVGRRAALAVLASLVIVACGDYAHSNPFDPAMPVELTIVGPDTLTAIGDTARFTLSTSPEFAHEEPTWTIESVTPTTSSFYIERIGAGVFLTRAFNAVRSQPTTATIVATLGGGRKAKTRFTIFPRPVTLRVDDCGVRAIRTISHSAITATTYLCARLLDRRNNAILTNDTAVATARNPSMVAISLRAINPANGETYWVTGLDTGMTQIVVRRGAFTDSVQLTVRQVLSAFALDPPACRSGGIPLRVGDTVRVKAGVGLDSLGIAMRDTTGIAARAKGMVFQTQPYYASIITVTADGLVSAIGRGTAFFYGSVADAGRTLNGSCWALVN